MSEEESVNRLCKVRVCLQAAVSVLSGGGVGIGDSVPGVDRELVAATCRTDGRILSLSHPLTITPLQEPAAFHLFRPFKP